MSEFSFIKYLRKRVPVSGRVCVGIGDDAAVLKSGSGKRLVVSTDVIVEGVDFTLKTLKPEHVGRKALAINLSDMAAMGAVPTAFVISVGKPRYVSDAWLKRFYAGLLALAKQYGVACVGGDFSAAKEFFASVTILGEAAGKDIVQRSGAKAGDWIAVTGALGGSLQRHHYDFTPRIREGLFLAAERIPNAMIDISDGLAQDLTHILEASKAGAVLDTDSIPISKDAKQQYGGNMVRALAAALGDGEDFELLFTVASAKRKTLENLWKKKFPKTRLSWIGRIEKGSPRVRWQVKGRKRVLPKILKKGYSHF